MGIQLSNCVENIVGENAPYEKFILFPHFFQKLSVVDASN